LVVICFGFGLALVWLCNVKNPLVWLWFWFTLVYGLALIVVYLCLWFSFDEKTTQSTQHALGCFFINNEIVGKLRFQSDRYS